MIKEASNCLDDQEFQQLLAARASTETLEDWWDHLSTCDPCSKRLDSVEREGNAIPDTLGRLVAANADSVLNIQNELECQAAVQRMMVDPSLRQSYDEPIQEIGAYRILRSLGEGGMGTVYLAEHQRLKKLVALKLLPREKSGDDAWLHRFDREMQAVASLENDHIVKASDAGDHDNWHYLVMEYLDGVDLAKLSHGCGAIPIGAACEIIRQVAIGLSAIHEVGLVHRDIKPSNIFLTRSGIAKVLDLGLVMRDDETLLKDERLTTVGNFLGTLTYMPPEQIEDSRNADHRSDIYALGATLYRLLTGRSLFHGIQQMAPIVRAISVGDFTPVREVRTAVPAELALMVERMLEVDPSQRPQSALEVADQLTQFAEAGEIAELITEASARSELTASKRSLLPQETPNPPSSSEKPPTKRNWLLLALVPFAIAAGVLLTIATDRGTIVIKSSDPDLKIQVTQNDEFVKELEIKSGENNIVLYSGKYEIALNDVDANEYRLSQSRVLLTRNGTEIVSIERKPNANASAATESSRLAGESSRSSYPKSSLSGPVYQGKSLDDWIAVVRTERDGDALVDAIKAIQLLSTPGTEQAAATAVLSPLEVFGSSFIGSDDKALSVLNKRFSAFTPESRIAALTTTLNGPSIRPGLALTFLTILDKKLSVQNDPELTCIGNPKNRELVSAFQQALAKWVDRAANATPRQFRDRRDERAVNNSIASVQEIRLKLLLAQPGIFELSKDSKLSSYVSKRAQKSLAMWKHLKNIVNKKAVPVVGVGMGAGGYGGGMDPYAGGMGDDDDSDRGGLGAGGGGMGAGDDMGGYGGMGGGGMGGGGLGGMGGGMGGMDLGYPPPIALPLVNACTLMPVDKDILECCLDGLLWHNSSWDHVLDQKRFDSLLGQFKILLDDAYQNTETKALLVRMATAARLKSKPPMFKIRPVSRKILKSRIEEPKDRLESVQLIALMLNSNSAMELYRDEQLIQQAMKHLLAVLRDDSAQDWQRFYALDALARFVVGQPSGKPKQVVVDGEIVYMAMASTEIRHVLVQAFTDWAPLIVKPLKEDAFIAEQLAREGKSVGTGSSLGLAGGGAAAEGGNVAPPSGLSGGGAADMYGAGMGGMGGMGGGGPAQLTWPMSPDNMQPTPDRNRDAQKVRDTLFDVFNMYDPQQLVSDNASTPCRQFLGDFIENQLSKKDQRWINFLEKNPKWKPN